MNYPSTSKIVCLFDDAFFANEVDQNPITEVGSHTLVDSQFGKASQLNEDSYFTTSESLSITNAFTISFRLFSINPGLGTDGTDLFSLNMALMSKSSFANSSGSTTSSDEQFIITEVSNPEGKNHLEIKLFRSTVSITKTEVYDPGEWNHFWIIYENSDIKVYLNAKLITTTTVGTIPSSLNFSSEDFAINLGTTGEDYRTVRNIGILDELHVGNGAISDINIIANSFNNGIEQALEDNLSEFKEVYLGLVYDDPQTIQINSILDNGTEVFIGRSDGTALRGSRKIWEHRRTFNNTREAPWLNRTLNPDDNNPNAFTYTEGVLTIIEGLLRV